MSPHAKGWTAAAGVVVVLVALGVPAYQGYLHRGRVADALQDGLREEIKAAVAAKGTKAASPVEKFPVKSRFARQIEVDHRTGTVRIALDADTIGRPEAVPPGSVIEYTAIFENDAITGWQCSRKLVDPKVLPALCR